MNGLHGVIAANKHFTATRKPSLYSNFRQLSEHNPTGYTANVLAWREVLEQALAHGVFGSALVVSAGPELVKAAADPQAGLPLALDCVLDELVAQGTLQPLQQYEAEYTRSRAARLAVAVWRLAFAARPAAGDLHGLRVQDYVSLPQTQQLARKLVAALAGEPATVSVDEAARRVLCTPQDARLALMYARSRGEVAFDAESALVRTRDPKMPISEPEKMLSRLHAQAAYLEEREKRLATSADECTAVARACAASSRPRARAQLQRRARLEQSREQAAAALLQIESVIQGIDAAHDAAQTLDALRAGAATLQQLNANAADAERVVDDVHDALADASDIGERLGTPKDIELDAELDAELDNLETEEREKERDTDRLAARARELDAEQRPRDSREPRSDAAGVVADQQQAHKKAEKEAVPA